MTIHSDCGAPEARTSRGALSTRVLAPAGEEKPIERRYGRDGFEHQVKENQVIDGELLEVPSE